MLVGLNRADDAGVYQLTDDIALVQTLDFFTPIVDDPYDFGRIAAVNALSDVYAMGGTPLTAMNIVGFPRASMEMSVLREILRGGGDVCAEAGVAVVGGHSVDDPELKFGLSVTGRVHPKKVLRKETARPGDKLILTKALGTGVITTSIKRATSEDPVIAGVIASMVQSNHRAAQVLQGYDVHAMTDITGFGLLGHAAEMVQGCAFGFIIDLASLPLLDGAIAAAERGTFPGGQKRNKKYRQAMVDVGAQVDPLRLELSYDPQTSGGLFAALASDQAEAALQALHGAGVDKARIVGEVVANPQGRIQLR